MRVLSYAWLVASLGLDDWCHPERQLTVFLVIAVCPVMTFFLAVRLRLSTVLSKFSHKIFVILFGCHPLEGVPLVTPLRLVHQSSHVQLNDERDQSNS